MCCATEIGCNIFLYHKRKAFFLCSDETYYDIKHIGLIRLLW